MNQKGIFSIIITSIIIGVLVIAGGIWYWQSQKGEQLTTTEESVVTTDKLKIIHPNGGEVFDLNSEITIKWNASQEFINNLEQNQIVEIYLIGADGFIAGVIANSLYDRSLWGLSCESSLLKKAGRISCVWSPEKTAHWGGLDFSYSPPRPGHYKILILSRDYRDSARETSWRTNTLALFKIFAAQLLVYANGGPLDTFITGYDKFFDNKILIIRDGKVEVEYELTASDVSDSDFILQ